MTMFPTADGPDTPTCSAKGCRADAAWALLWNNPKLHPPKRRKTWLACEEHRTGLTEFLASRTMLREVEPIDAGPGRGGSKRS